MIDILLGCSAVVFSAALLGRESLLWWKSRKDWA